MSANNETKQAPAVEAGARDERELPQSVLDALRFYAHGHHYNIDSDHQQFDTVSGEPQNWLFSERDDDFTMIEDGSIARAALCGGSQGFEEPTTPVEGEIFRAALARASEAAAGETDISSMVNRFLGWKLPQDFAPDAEISFKPPANPDWWPTGTNLFHAEQARQMFEYATSHHVGGNLKLQSSIADHLFIDQRDGGSWLVCVEKVHDNEDAAREACLKWKAVLAAPQPASEQQAAQGLNDDARECLTDLVTHYFDFVEACQMARSVSSTQDDKAYWTKQIDVLARMRAQAERAIIAAKGDGHE